MGVAPLLAVGIAMAAASAAMQQRAANQQTDARNKALEAEFDRQEDFRGQAKQVFEAAASGQTRDVQDKALRDVEGERLATIEGNIQGGRGVDNFIPTSSSAPKVVQSEIGKRIGAALNEGKEQARRVAQLGAFGDQQFNNRVALGRSRGDLASLGSLDAGSANVLPFALNAANQKGHGARTAADILGGLSSAAFSGAGGGGFSSMFSSQTPAVRTDAAGRVLGGV